MKTAYKTLTAATLLLTLYGCGSSTTTTHDSESPSNTDSTQPANTAPIADAGMDSEVAVGQAVYLDGQGSSDPDGDELTFQWVIEQLPEDSRAVLINQTHHTSHFDVDVMGIYVISLRVSDGDLASDADTITVTANNQGVDITNLNFTNQSADCNQYVGSYFANVSDLQRAISFSGNTEISDQNEHCQLVSNEIPNHDFNDQSARFATDVAEQASTFAIPKSPALASNAMPLDLQVTNVVFLNGATLDLLAAACYGVGNEPLGEEKIGCGPDQIDNPWRYDPMSSLNRFGTDAHNAHTQPDGTYHYHGNPIAMFNQDCELTGEASPVIGFAADGFPVFGFCFKDANGSIRKARSSYVLKNDAGPRQDIAGYETPVAGIGGIVSANHDGQFIGDWEYQEGAGDLDECNGMAVDGQYGYFVTDQYPWVMACFKGEPDTSFYKQGAALENRMHSHDGEWHSH